MELLRVSDKTDHKRVKKLYRASFPLIERVPFCYLKSKALQGKADFWEIIDENIFIGFAYVVSYKDIAYLFYLAVDNSFRGSGYGTKAMECLREKYNGNRLYLALEMPDKSAGNYEQREKRHSFYERCGLLDLPYRLKEGIIVYSTMGTGGIVRPEENIELFDAYFGRFIRNAIDIRFI